MTPERKKRLRVLLRRKAAEEVKRQQEQKEKERLRIITQRTGTPKSTADANEGKLGMLKLANILLTHYSSLTQPP